MEDRLLTLEEGGGGVDRRLIVAGVILLIIGVAAFIFLTGSGPQEETTTAQVAMKKVCFKDPTGSPLEGVQVVSGAFSTVTDEKGCTMVPEDIDRISARLLWFEAYEGTPKSSITLAPDFPRVEFVVVGTTQGEVVLLEGGKEAGRFKSGDYIVLVSSPTLEEGNAYYCEASGGICKNLVALLVVDGKKVDEKPVPAPPSGQTQKLVLEFTRERARAAPNSFTVLVEVNYTGIYDSARLSVTSSDEPVTSQEGKPPFTVELPRGEYTFTTILMKDGIPVAESSTRRLIEKDTVVKVSHFKELKYIMSTIEAADDGTVYVVKDDNVLDTFPVERGDVLRKALPERSEVILVGTDGRVLVATAAKEVRLGLPDELHTLEVRVIRGSEPAAGAEVTVKIGPIKVSSSPSDKEGKAVFKLSPAPYSVCASYEGFVSCESVYLKGDSTVQVNVLRPSRKVVVLDSGKPAEGYVVVNGLRFQLTNGETLIPDGDVNVSLEVNGRKVDLSIQEGNAVVDVRSGTTVSSQGSGTLVIEAPPGTAYVVKSPDGSVVASGSVENVEEVLQLPPGRYMVATFSGGKTKADIVQVEDGGVVTFEMPPPPPEETYPLLLEVVSDTPVHVLIFSGSRVAYEGEVQGTTMVQLPEGYYVIKASLGGSEESNLIHIPEVNHLRFVFIDPEPRVELSLLSPDGRVVKRAKVGETYDLKVAAFSRLPASISLKIEGLELNVEDLSFDGGDYVKVFRDVRVTGPISVQAVLATEKGEDSTSLSVPVGEYPVLCDETVGVCFGSAVKGTRYVWRVEVEERADYQVVGDSLQVDLRNVSVYEGNLPVGDFVSSHRALHLFFRDGDEFYRIEDPVGGIYDYPNRGGLTLFTQRVPPVSNVVIEGEFYAPVPFQDAWLILTGDDCSPSYTVYKEEVKQEALPTGGYRWVMPFKVFTDARGCTSLTVTGYSIDGRVSPTSQRIDVEEMPFSISVPSSLTKGDKNFIVLIRNYLPYPVTVGIRVTDDNPYCEMVFNPEETDVTVSSEAEVTVHFAGCENEEGNVVVSAELKNHEGFAVTKYIPFSFWDRCLELADNKEKILPSAGTLSYRLRNVCGYPLTLLDCGGWTCPTEVGANAYFEVSKDVNESGRESISLVYLDRYGKERRQSFDVYYYVVDNDAQVILAPPGYNLARSYEDVTSYMSLEVVPPPGLSFAGLVSMSIGFDYDACQGDYLSSHPRASPEEALDYCQTAWNTISFLAEDVNLSYNPYNGAVWVDRVKLDRPVNPFELNDVERSWTRYLLLTAVVRLEDLNGNEYLASGYAPVRWEPSLSVHVDARHRDEGDTHFLDVNVEADYPVPFALQGRVVVETNGPDTVRYGDGGWSDRAVIPFDLGVENRSLTFPVQYLRITQPYTLTVRVYFDNNAFGPYEKEFTIRGSGTGLVEPPSGPDRGNSQEDEGVTLPGCDGPFYYVKAKFLPYDEVGNVDKARLSDYVDNLSTIYFDRTTLEALRASLEDEREDLDDLVGAAGEGCSNVDVVSLLEDYVLDGNESALGTVLDCCEKVGKRSFCADRLEGALKYVALPVLYVDAENGVVFKGRYNFHGDTFIAREEVFDELGSFARYYGAWKDLLYGSPKVSGEAPIVLEDESASHAYIFPFQLSGGCTPEGVSYKCVEGRCYAFSDQKIVDVTFKVPEGTTCTVMVDNERLNVENGQTVRLARFLTLQEIRKALEEGDLKLCYAAEDGRLLLYPDPKDVVSVAGGKETRSAVYIKKGESVLAGLNFLEWPVLGKSVEVPVGYCPVPSYDRYDQEEEIENGALSVVPPGEVRIYPLSFLRAYFGDDLLNGLDSSYLIPLLCKDGNLYAFTSIDDYFKAIEYRYRGDYDRLSYVLGGGLGKVVEGDGAVYIDPDEDVPEDQCKDFYDATGGYFHWEAILTTNEGGASPGGGICVLTDRKEDYHCRWYKENDMNKADPGDSVYLFCHDGGCIAKLYPSGEAPAQYSEVYTCQKGERGTTSWREGQGSATVFLVKERTSSGIETVGYLYVGDISTSTGGGGGSGRRPTAYAVLGVDDSDVVGSTGMVVDRGAFEQLNLVEGKVTYVTADGVVGSVPPFQEGYSLWYGDDVVWHDLGKKYRMTLEGCGDYCVVDEDVWLPEGADYSVFVGSSVEESDGVGAAWFQDAYTSPRLVVKGAGTEDVYVYSTEEPEPLDELDGPLVINGEAFAPPDNIVPQNGFFLAFKGVDEISGEEAMSGDRLTWACSSSGCVAEESTYWAGGQPDNWSSESFSTKYLVPAVVFTSDGRYGGEVYWLPSHVLEELHFSDGDLPFNSDDFREEWGTVFQECIGSLQAIISYNVRADDSLPLTTDVVRLVGTSSSCKGLTIDDVHYDVVVTVEDPEEIRGSSNIQFRINTEAREVPLLRAPKDPYSEDAWMSDWIKVVGIVDGKVRPVPLSRPSKNFSRVIDLEDSSNTSQTRYGYLDSCPVKVLVNCESNPRGSTTWSDPQVVWAEDDPPTTPLPFLVLSIKLSEEDERVLAWGYIDTDGNPRVLQESSRVVGTRLRIFLGLGKDGYYEEKEECVVCRDR